jgi:hypothetical protein
LILHRIICPTQYRNLVLGRKYFEEMEASIQEEVKTKKNENRH